MNKCGDFQLYELKIKFEAGDIMADSPLLSNPKTFALEIIKVLQSIISSTHKEISSSRTKNRLTVQIS